MPGPDTQDRTLEVDLPSLEDDLALIRTVAKAAGALAMPYFRREQALDVEFKPGNSPVSAADHTVNAYLMQHLRTARPHYGWLSEETLDDDMDARIRAPRTFVVDPIDGTRGFIDGSTQWCVSVGIVEARRPVAGVLVCPARGEIFHAVVGGGAFLNGAPLKLGLSDPSPVIGGPRLWLDALAERETMPLFRRHPHVPSLAYRLAMIATGRLDATFVRPRSHDWDLAAADIILSEAGGILADIAGDPVLYNGDDVEKPSLVGAHADLADVLLGVVATTPFR